MVLELRAKSDIKSKSGHNKVDVKDEVVLTYKLEHKLTKSPSESQTKNNSTNLKKSQRSVACRL